MPKNAETLSVYTTKRLETYYPFSRSVLLAVKQFVDTVETFSTYQDFFAHFNIPARETVFTDIVSLKAVPVIDIPAQKKEQGAIVYHLPMGNPLDTNQKYQLAAIAATNPAYRIIGFGNPSGRPHRFKDQSLSLREAWRVARHKDLTPLVAAELAYLKEQEITKVHHIGFSFGSIKALIEAKHQSRDTLASLTIMEPPSHPRPIWRLVKDFQQTLQPLGRYVERTKLKTYQAARNDAITPKESDRGLLRLINIAIAFMLAKNDVVQKIDTFLSTHPDIPVSVVWGGNSELINDTLMNNAVKKWSQAHANFFSIRLKDDYHALGNDVPLNIALIRHIIERTEKS